MGNLVIAACVMGSVSLQAHHSLAGVYDMKVEKEATGTVARIQFVNPHGSMTVTVKNPDGTTTDWIFTTGSATRMADRGIGKGTLKAGDTITAKFIPARDGKALGFLKTVTTPDGKVYELSAGNPND
ncbi:MAG: DUF6152 family protein [Acidobacteriota bacterium]